MRTEEAIDLYTLTKNPEQLAGFEKKDTHIPEIAWEKIAKSKKSTKSKMLLFQQYEDLFAKSAVTALSYTKFMRYANPFQPVQRFLKGEPAIIEGSKKLSRNGKYSPAHEYWRLVGEHRPTSWRWPEAESIISSVPSWSLEYVEKVIKGRWIPGEKALAKDPFYGVQYAEAFLKGPFPAMEPALLKKAEQRFIDAEILTNYVRKFLKQSSKRLDTPLDFIQAYEIIRQRVANLKANKNPLTEELNLYKYSTHPEQLIGFKQMTKIPFMMWNAVKKKYKYQLSYKKLKPYARVWARDPWTALEYSEYRSRHVRHDKVRWLPGEPAILTDPAATEEYINQNFEWGERWPEAEPVLINSNAIWYARRFIDGAWPELEAVLLPRMIEKYKNDKVIKTSSDDWMDDDSDDIHGFMQYIFTARKAPWPEAEELISKCPRYAIEYGRRFKKRMPLAEPILLTSSVLAARYAAVVLKSRWPESESIILKKAGAAVIYAAGALKSRWPEAEALIATVPGAALTYAKKVIHGPFLAGEPAILAHPDRNKNIAYTYVTQVLGQKLPPKRYKYGRGWGDKLPTRAGKLAAEEILTKRISAARKTGK